jgi:hypothetical protein
MSQERRRPESSAGAFMGPDIMVPMPTRRLGIDPEPKVPASEESPPEPQRGLAERIVGRLRRGSKVR